jgi:exonuclease VII small subunit
MSYEDFKKSKEKWLAEKSKYDEAVRLFESIVHVLEFQQAELNIAFSEFVIAQAKHTQRLKSSRRNIKQVKED